MRRIGRAGTVALIAAALVVAGGIRFLRASGGPDALVAGARRVASRTSAVAADQPVVASGTLAQTIAGLQRRLRTLPGDWDAAADLGLAYVQQARITADPSYYPKADGILRRSLRIHPRENFSAMTGLAALAAARHDFSGALSWATRGERIDPQSANIHAVAGDALVELGRYGEAFGEFQRAVDLRPDLSTYARASYALELQGDVADARAAMERALQAAASASDAAWASNQLGDLAFNAGHLDTAERDYRDAIARDPTFVVARAGLANVAAARGDLAGAVAAERWVVQRYPAPQYVIALGDLFASGGEPAQAERQFGLLRLEERLFQANGVDMDLEIAQFSADHRVDVARGLAAARDEWRRRQSVTVADALAWALYANGRYAEALPYADSALRLGTRSAPFLFHRGMIERALGDDALAVADLSRCLRVAPRFSVLWSATARRTLDELRSAA